MDNISYVRAGISCLPVIGPYMSLVNNCQILTELGVSDFHMNAWKSTSEPLMERLELLRKRLCSLSIYSGLCISLREETDAQKRLELKKHIAELREKIPRIDQEGWQVMLQNEREAHSEWRKEWQVIKSEGLEIKNRADLISEKRNIHFLCGTVGSVLTVATVVALVALGILSSGGLVVFAVAVCWVGSVVTVIRSVNSDFADSRLGLADAQQQQLGNISDFLASFLKLEKLELQACAESDIQPEGANQ